MPLGWERLNTKTSTPNTNIVFIKPLPGPTEPTAQDFLNRLSAICVPICRANHLYVASLEEFPPNREFWGRNFNAGEVIQLVLRSPSTGRWLPFRFVQMVLMHELAHCKEMNHSGAFWKVRNAYAAELRVLWGKGYTGEGLWGRGQSLYDGQYTGDALPSDEVLAASLCGGTYRTRRKRKRKRDGEGKQEKPKVTYAERKQRRIEKKFGKAGQGQTLGGDEDVRASLEGGKKIKAKPRVANSDRGRNLRAAAAEARLKAAAEVQIKAEESDTDSEFDWPESDDEKPAVDTDGTNLVDSKGNGLVKVCEDEDAANDPNAMNELRELERMSLNPPSDTSGQLRLTKKAPPPALEEPTRRDQSTATHRQKVKQQAGTRNSDTLTTNIRIHKLNPVLVKKEPVTENTSSVIDLVQTRHTLNHPDDTTSHKGVHSQSAEFACPVCSCENEACALTCIACAHVLNTKKVPNYWRCKSLACRGGTYINSGDAGVCGVCGARKHVGR